VFETSGLHIETSA